MTVITIAIDVMGGDIGPPVTIPASLEVLANNPSLRLILVGDEDIIKQALKSKSYDTARLSVHHASQRVEMNEAPSQALRTKKDSSMRVAINLVKEGSAQACVSAGNTGALMATAKFVLKTIPGIDRPAIISTFPTSDPNKHMRMLDLGANVDSTAEHLLQFAVMGSVLSSTLDNIERPKVYLLNIGEEEIKGNEQVKHTALLLSQTASINYMGFIEGHALNQGAADVVVCDGFVGNVAIKSAEGIAEFILNLIKDAFNKNLYTKAVGLLVKPVFNSFRKRIDPAHYNGAMFIGLQGIVIKSHGGATVYGFRRAIEQAILSVERDVTAKISHEVEELLHIPPAEEEP